MSLRTRVGLLVGGTVLLASLIGGVGIALSSLDVGVGRVDEALRSEAARVNDGHPGMNARLRASVELRRSTCETSEVGPSFEAAEGTGQRQRRDEAGLSPTGGARANRMLPEFATSFQLIASNGVIVSGCQELPVDAADLEIARTGDGERIATVSIDDERYRILTVPAGNAGAMQFARSLDITDDTVRSLFLRTVLFGGLGAVAAGLIGWAVARRATRPIERLGAAADRVAHTRDLGERIEVEGSDEIAGLAASFNTMLSSLDTMREQQHRLVQDASHELRTPLTSIRTNIDLLRRRPDVPVEMRGDMLEDISSELDELTELTAELVDSATEVRTDPARSTAFDLARVAAECVERTARRYDRDIRLTVDPASASAVVGDPGLVARAVTNLLNNAVKFTDSASDPIEIRISGGVARVLDRGPGIEPADLPHVFDRFFRATASRSAPGSGLGLAIVKQVAEGHGGSVFAANRPDGGLEIGFSLPTENSAPDA